MALLRFIPKTRKGLSAMGGKIGASVCALAVLFGTVAQASPCAHNDEITAVQVASIQQQLMVAALTCGQTVNYNAFQTSYGNELRRSDATLMHMFQRFYGGRGDAEYHAFKTRVANDSELRSIHDNPTYCAVAQNVFASALTPAKPTLASFVTEVPIMESNPFDSCEVSVANRFPAQSSATANASSEDNRSMIWQREYGAPVAVANTPPIPPAPGSEQ